MSYKFIKELDATLEETTNITGNISVICESNAEDIQSLYETATQFLANAKNILTKGGDIPDNVASLIAALRVLSSADYRNAIASEEGGRNVIRDKLNASGKDQKTNQSLINITKSAAKSAFEKAFGEVQSAKTDEAARKQLINTVGKMMSILDRVQTQSDSEKEDPSKMSDWFK